MKSQQTARVIQLKWCCLHALRINPRLVLLLSALVLLVNGQIDPIAIKGSRFFHEKSGSQFFIRALFLHDSGRSSTNSTSFIDTLADSSVCERDIPYFLKLKINTLMIDVIDLTRDHASCMNQLAKAGIFTLFFLNGQTNRSYRSGGDSRGFWDYEYYNRMQGIIDEYQKYPNTLGFVHAVRSDTYMATLPLVKAAVVHMKEYIKNKSYRRIPIGVGSGEVATTESSVADFINCGDKDSSADFLYLSVTAADHSHCLTSSSLLQSRMIETYSNYSIPTFLFYGCKATEQHNYTEVQDIFGEAGSKTFAGAGFREWFEDWDWGEDIALVDIKGPNVIPRPGYSALSSQLATINPSSVMMQQHTPTNTPAATCRKLVLKDRDPAAAVMRDTELATNLPAKPYQRLCSCMMDSLVCSIPNETSPGLVRDKLDSLCKATADRALCKGVKYAPDKGEYGSFLSCAEVEKGAWLFNQYLVKGRWSPADCISFGGAIQTPSPTPKPTDCEILLRQAGPDGTGTVTYTPPIPTDAANRRGPGGDYLKKSQKIGIALGVVSSAILLAIILLVVRFRSKKKQAKAVEGEKGEEFEKAELPDSEVERSATTDQSRHIAYKGLELDGNEKTELAADVPNELEANEKYELEVLDKKLETHDGDEIYELSGSPVDQDRRFSFDSQVDTIIKS